MMHVTNQEALIPIGEVLGLPFLGATKLPVVGGSVEKALEIVSQAMHAGEGWIGGKVAGFTQSQAFGEASQQVFMQGVLFGGLGAVSKGMKVLKTTGKAEAQMRVGAQSVEVEARSAKNIALHQELRKDLRKAHAESIARELAHEEGKVIAGATHSRPVWDIQRIVEKHGGEASDWVKKVSLKTSDGVEAHYIENLRTGQKIDIKPIDSMKW